MRGRIILQDLVSHHYLTAAGWGKNCQEARTFEHTYMALLEGLQQHERSTQVVWCFRNPGANFYVPVHPEDAERIYPCVSCPLIGIQPARDRERVSVSSGRFSFRNASNVNSDKEVQDEQYQSQSGHSRTDRISET